MNVKQLVIIIFFGITLSRASEASMEKAFQNPSVSSWPGVYWYFMDGNLNRKEMTTDLESMKKAGLGNLIFLEVNVRVPRGPVGFMSEEWQEMFAHAVHEAERLGIDITLGTGPGWTGSGGPWIKPEQSMQHLVFSEIKTKGPEKIDIILPLPKQRTNKWHKTHSPFYEDVIIYAFPSCKPIIKDIDEKALYIRKPYTLKIEVKPYLPAPVKYNEPVPENVISIKKVINLTQNMDSDGRLQWDVPEGEWMIVRMGRRFTGSSTRPAPEPGLGPECDKFSSAALDHHFKNYYGKLIKKVGPRKGKHGWTTMHIDSWEMGAQNWTSEFIKEFKNRRGYDPEPYLLVYTGRVVKSLEISERFLWDLRMTGQELVLENHANHLKKLSRKHGFELSIEPYDMNPTADLDLGAVADIPMCEFWSAGYGFDSSYSCIEATSIAHTMGRSIVAAEAFTANRTEMWKQYPWSMKNQGDWAFCMGINRFVYHTFAHKPLGEKYRPGMTMGPYGVHWDRGQTWWPLIKDYHLYISRCSYMLRQGVTVSDILYLTPEGAPHVFRPPQSALEGSNPLADKKEYGFDGCSPNILMARAGVKDGKITFPNGTSYQLMVLPQFKTMTLKLLTKIEYLVKAGAAIVGTPPVKSPSLSNYPACDVKVKSLAKKLWGGLEAPGRITKHKYGRGSIYWGGTLSQSSAESPELYPSYGHTIALLKKMGIKGDFTANGPVRYTHRSTKNKEIYFVANKTDSLIRAECIFRIVRGEPQLWNPVNGEQRPLLQYKKVKGLTTIPMKFDAYESFFIVFTSSNSLKGIVKAKGRNFPDIIPVTTLKGSWKVSFDQKRGGPEKVIFDTLKYWNKQKEPGIKFYSGIAIYKKSFNQPEGIPKDSKIYLNLGTVHDMARIRLNGKDLGVAWCAPWQVDISDVIKAKENHLEIEVANRWLNRLIGDMKAPDKDVRTVQWPSGFLGGKEYKAGRYTFSTYKPRNKGPKTAGHPKLLPSGLIGPVRILAQKVLKKRR